MSWLFQEGLKAKKHTNWVHPLTTFVLHHSGVAISTIMAHDWMVGQYKNSSHNESNPDNSVPPPLHRRNVAYFLTAYFLWFFACRLGLHWKAKEAPSVFYCEFYKQTFLCSVTLFHAALALYTDRPIIATAFCIAVGPDQLLWYVDLAVYLVCGKFPIGVTKYLFWPGTTWASRLTSTHHLWTIPLVLWASGGIHLLSLPLSAVVVVANVSLSRWMTPHSIEMNEDDVRYLNINLSHEIWTDVKNIQFLRIYEGKLPWIFRLFCLWLSFNSIVFTLLYLASARILGQAPLC